LQKQVASNAVAAPQQLPCDSGDSMIVDIMDIPDLPSLPQQPPSVSSVSVRAAVQQANLKDASAVPVPAASRAPVQRRPSIGAQGQTTA
jgi:hypothetical protein